MPDSPVSNDSPSPTALPLDGPLPFTARELRAGLRATLPLIPGVLVFGMAYGLFAQQAGLTMFETLAMSALVFAGASQFVAVGMFATGAPGGLIVLSTLFINLRHLLMGLSLAPFLRRDKTWVQALLAFGIVDESYVLTTTHWLAQPADKGYMVGTQVALLAVWLLSGWLGARLGPAIGDPRAWGLDFALVATFIGLLVPQVRDNVTLLVALVAGAVAVAGSLVLPGNWYILLAALAALVLALFLEARR